jgi:hypothetical protein
LKKQTGRPLLECYQELSRKFPQGLADVLPLLEELSGEVNGVARITSAMENEVGEHSRL